MQVHQILREIDANDYESLMNASEWLNEHDGWQTEYANAIQAARDAREFEFDDEVLTSPEEE